MDPAIINQIIYSSAFILALFILSFVFFRFIRDDIFYQAEGDEKGKGSLIGRYRKSLLAVTKHQSVIMDQEFMQSDIQAIHPQEITLDASYLAQHLRQFDIIFKVWQTKGLVKEGALLFFFKHRLAAKKAPLDWREFFKNEWRVFITMPFNLLSHGRLKRGPLVIYPWQSPVLLSSASATDCLEFGEVDMAQIKYFPEIYLKMSMEPVSEDLFKFTAEMKHGEQKFKRVHMQCATSDSTSLITPDHFTALEKETQTCRAVFLCRSTKSKNGIYPLELNIDFDTSDDLIDDFCPDLITGIGSMQKRFVANAPVTSYRWNILIKAETLPGRVPENA